jgi:GNAT superfamily N-acetyltransferase
MTRVSIERRSLAHPDVQAMITQLDRELDDATPDEGTNFFSLDDSQLQPGHGAFFVAMIDGRPVGCGAYRRIDGVAAEVKRMWTDPAARGNGVGSAVLDAIVDGARSDGYSELRLETGEFLEGAMALYRKYGFEECEQWGEYVGVPLSYCMSRTL